MYRIHKQILKTTDIQKITLPKGAEILSIQHQHDHPCVWFRFNDTTSVIEDTVTMEDRWIVLCGTGHECPPPDKGRFISTNLVMDGQYVWHFFELTDVK
jgi:hypothetical protein